ncbi:MAG: hypothetical protein GYB68_06320 [Chloroflexi bacterium]|nr:hypothetical protein [Chloroflexota bacterium]
MNQQSANQRSDKKITVSDGAKSKIEVYTWKHAVKIITQPIRDYARGYLMISKPEERLVPFLKSNQIFSPPVVSIFLGSILVLAII